MYYIMLAGTFNNWPAPFSNGHFVVKRIKCTYFLLENNLHIIFKHYQILWPLCSSCPPNPVHKKTRTTRKQSKLFTILKAILIFCCILIFIRRLIFVHILPHCFFFHLYMLHHCFILLFCILFPLSCIFVIFCLFFLQFLVTWFGYKFAVQYSHFYFHFLML